MKDKSRTARETKIEQAKDLFKRADQEQELGSKRVGFKLLLQAAELGYESAQVNLGYSYDLGIGVRRNRDAALFWYRKAYRNGRGPAIAASNIATIFRDEQNIPQAIRWFRRAVERGDYDAALDIAKLYIVRPKGRRKAIEWLRIVLAAKPPIGVGEDTQHEAHQMLRSLQKSNNIG